MHTTHSNTQYKNESKHSEMDPVRQNPIQRTVSLFICVCIALCIVAHNIAENRPDSFHPYPPDNHHCSDDVYLTEGTGSGMEINLTGDGNGNYLTRMGGNESQMGSTRFCIKRSISQGPR